MVFDLLNEIKSLSRVRLFATPWTGAHQVPPSMGFSRQECWNGSPFPSPEDLPRPGIKPGSPALQADSLPSKPPRNPTGMSTGTKFLGDSDIQPLSHSLIILPSLVTSILSPTPTTKKKLKSTDPKLRALVIKMP